MRDETKRSVIAGGAGAVILIIMFAVTGTYEPGVPSTGSTGLVETTYASGTAPLAFAKLPPENLLPGQCQSVPPPVPVPGGGECRALGCRSRRGMVVGHTYACPPGWQVVSGQAVPWNP